MDIITLIDRSPLVTVIVVYLICELLFRIYNRTIRHLNIRKHGWPPEHCDADGDFKEQDDPTQL